jgi:hypothetical protein
VSAPTDDDIQALLVLQVGEVPGSLLASNVATAWALHDGEPDAVKRLTVRLDLIDIALGYYRGIVSFTDADHSQQASDMAKRLLDMRKSLTDALVLALEEGEGEEGPAGGLLTAVTPWTPPPVACPLPAGTDVSFDPRVTGSPYGRRRVRMSPW